MDRTIPTVVKMETLAATTKIARIIASPRRGLI
jgi:hypothetical protein